MTKHGPADLISPAPPPPLRSFAPRLLAAIVVIGAAIWGFLYLKSEVGEGETAAIDRSLILALRQTIDPNQLRGPHWLHETARDITALGGFTVLGLITIAAIAVLLVYNRRRQAGVFAVAAIGAQVLAEAVKHVVGRPRPAFVAQYDLIASSSFPSGHSMMAPAIYFTLAAIVAAGRAPPGGTRPADGRKHRPRPRDRGQPRLSRRPLADRCARRLDPRLGGRAPRVDRAALAGDAAVTRAWLIVVAAAALIVATVAAFGHPTVFTDTDDYYALGHELAVDAGFVAPPELDEHDTVQAKIDAHMGRTQMASRSAVYAVFLYAIESAGTMWLVTAAQAVAAAWTVATLWRVALPERSRWGAVAAVAVLVVLTPLAFFTGFAMPDIFAAIGALAAALLLFFPDRIGRGERWGLAVLLVFSLAVHTSHLLMAVVLVAVAGGILLMLGVERRVVVRRLALFAALIVAAGAANSVYGLGIRLTTGERLRNQPFLTARLLADGPGRDYLRHACAAGERFTLCRFAHKPLADSEDILWSDLPGTGVFMLSDFATRMALEDQEGRFVLGTLGYAPVAQLGASLRNWGQQLGMVFVDDPVRDPAYYLTDPYWRQTNLPPMIARVADCGPKHDRCRSRLTVPGSKAWHGTAAVAAVAVALAALLWRRRGSPPLPPRLVAATAFLLAAVVVNAGVCGVLSGPFARYQARIVWLVPLAAMLLVAGRRRVGEGADGLAA